MDSRFGLPGNQNGLSKWVRPHILPDEGFGRANQNLAQFYIKARENAEKEAELMIAQQSLDTNPTNVSIILKYEDEGNANNQLPAMANDDNITKVAFIRKDAVEKENGESKDSNDENYIDPQRVIARVDMDKLSEEQLANSLAASSRTSSQQAEPNSEQEPSLPSLTSQKHKPKIISGKNLQPSPAVQFFQLVKSTTTLDEFDSIKKCAVLLKKYEHMKFRKEFIRAARSIIDIILKHEELNSRSRTQKPELLGLLLQLLPKHFVNDVEQVTIDLTFRKLMLRKELKSGVAPKEYMKFHMEFVKLLQKVWFGESTQKNDHQFVQNLGKLLGSIVKYHEVTKSALSQCIDIVPSELQRLTTALIDEIKASIDVSKIRAEEKALVGENAVKVEYFRRNYLNEKGKSLSISKEDDSAKNANPSATMKSENQIGGSKSLKSKVDSRSDSQVFSKIKAVKNPYAKSNGKIRLESIAGENPSNSNSSITVREKTSLSTILKKRMGSSEQCNRNEMSAAISSSSSLRTILRQSGSDTYAGETRKMRRTVFSSNAPKNVTCTICNIPLEKLYISECGHMACLQCWQQWLDRSDTCPQCRRPASMKSIALAVFRGEL
mmetsp:Transcript_26504/g.55615  ORF Transcript_26504/g.55615 Transcript_26504/m.55615 type:complete len:608 (+) Transcript_26504:3-1826(+)